MRDFHELKGWSSAHALTLCTYRATARFPNAEMYGLTSQMRRASASIAANIAEGCGRGGNAEFVRFLRIAVGSACEMEYHLLLARDLNYLGLDEYSAISQSAVKLKRMLNSLIAKTLAA